MFNATLKKDILLACMVYIRKRIDAARRAMEEAQEAANEETKGSAGDKHETGRAMMQIERDKHARILADAMEQEQILNQVNVSDMHLTVHSGSLVLTDKGTFFISIGAGKINSGLEEVFAIAPFSPLGQVLLGRQKGDCIECNGRKYVITGIL